MREVDNLVRHASTTQATALIRGESGSGKDVIARRIYELGPRGSHPFVKLHCAALPESAQRAIHCTRLLASWTVLAKALKRSCIRLLLQLQSPVASRPHSMGHMLQVALRRTMS